ncbi:MAG: ChbG/HpnK family deacetylase, partial [Lachnospiraceae bacterium]|nr:ChbG/HpnK family deacetylase [Lachnospiraceae bacterium]
MKTDIHADDFALTPNTSKDILDCMKKGRLDSISIVPNMSCFDDCMDMLYEAIPSLPFLPKMSVHLNLVEGTALSGSPALKGLSWKDLFLGSYLPSKRKLLLPLLTKEISAQIEKCAKASDRCLLIAKEHDISCSQNGLRIDSHQHTHHIPIVWKALMNVTEERDLNVEYIRNSREPLSVFFGRPELFASYRPVNMIKNIILSLYSKKIDDFCYLHGMQKMYLWGLVMSGRMDSFRIQKLKNLMKKKAEKDGRELEILFHPGLAADDEVTCELDPKAARDFYLDRCRHVEKESVMK